MFVARRWLVVCVLVGLANSGARGAHSTERDSYRFSGRTIDLRGWTVADTAEDGTVVLFRGPITSPTSDRRRMWERWEYPNVMDDVRPPYRSDVQLIEVECAGQRMRSLQRSTFSNSNIGAPTGWTTSMPSEWNFVPPGTMAESLLRVACNAVRGVPTSAALIDYEQIDDAVEELHRQMTAGGIAAATLYSAECFRQLTRKPSWSALDYCVAFDAAAGALDAGVARQLGVPLAKHFLPADQLARALSALKLVSNGTVRSHERLDRINGQALLQLDRVEWGSSPE